MKSNSKKPWLAVALNVFPLVMGLGYIYLGLWKRFAVVFLLQLFTLAPMTGLGLREYNKYLLGLIWLFTLFDAYKQALNFNRMTANHSLSSADDIRDGAH